MVLLAAIAAGAAVLTTAGYLISPDTVRHQVLSEVRAVTGGKLDTTVRYPDRFKHKSLFFAPCID